MLLTYEQMRKLRWLHRVPKEENNPKGWDVTQYVFESDGTETKDDLEFMVQWAKDWSQINGYAMIVNIEDVKKRLKELKGHK